MNLYGAGGYAKLAAGLLVGLAVGDQLQHLTLARGELGEAPYLDLALAVLERCDVHVAA